MQFRPVLIAASLVPLLSSSAGATDGDSVSLLPIQIHVVHVDGEPIADGRFIDEQLERANAIFGRYGVRFVELGARQALAARHGDLDTRKDRDALGAYVRPGAIHCFIVRALRDVDEPARMRRGVHWRSRAYPGVRYVVLSSIAGSDVLAHELGHYLGNPEHSDTPGNLMSYQRAEPELPFLDETQLRRVRAAIRHAGLDEAPKPRD